MKSLAAHPGYAATNLQSAAAPLVDRLVMRVSNAVVAQSDEMGALPVLYAATQPGVEGGLYIGPDGLGEQRGHPKVVKPSGAARDEAAASRLWDVSRRAHPRAMRLRTSRTATGSVVRSKLSPLRMSPSVCSAALRRPGSRRSSRPRGPPARRPARPSAAPRR